jgi:hypothetical protein
MAMSTKRDVPWFPIVTGAGVVAIGLSIAFGAAALNTVPRDKLRSDLPAISGVPSSPSPTPTLP